MLLLELEESIMDPLTNLYERLRAQAAPVTRHPSPFLSFLTMSHECHALCPIGPTSIEA
jgi:hypothetical protein